MSGLEALGVGCLRTLVSGQVQSRFLCSLQQPSSPQAIGNVWEQAELRDALHTSCSISAASYVSPVPSLSSLPSPAHKCGE